MPPRSWAERVDDELVRRGVPARFRRRLLAELRDHSDDLKDEGMPMSDALLEERVGEPAALAATATDQYRRATWVGRHPLLVFGLLPVPAMLLALTGTVFALVAVAHLAVWVFGEEGLSDLPRPVVAAAADALVWVLRLVPFLLLGWLFTRLYLRHQIGRGWYAAAAAQVLFLAGSFLLTVHHSDVPEQSMMMAGFAWMPPPTDDVWGFFYRRCLYDGQLLQVLLPAAVAGLMLRAARRRAAVVEPAMARG